MAWRTLLRQRIAGTRGLFAPRGTAVGSTSQKRRVSTASDEDAQRIHVISSQHKLRISELAGIAGLSEYHFIRAFQRETGVTPYQYVLRMRVNKASELLRQQPYISIDEIALLCGFGSASALAQQFRRLMGMSPRHIVIACDRERPSLCPVCRGQPFRHYKEGSQRSLFDEWRASP